MSEADRVDVASNFTSSGLRPDCWSSLEMEVVWCLVVQTRRLGGVLFRRLELGIDKSRI